MHAGRVGAGAVLVLALVVGGAAVAEKITFEPAPYEKYGALMVPAEGLAKALGGGAKYDLATGNVTLTIPDREGVVFRVGEPSVTVGETTQPIGWPAELRYGAAYVPLRIAVEALGGDVRWDEVTQTATFGDCEVCTLAPPPRRGEPRVASTDPAHPGPVADVALSADGKRAAALYASGRCDVWDLQTGKLVLTVTAAEDAVPAPDARMALSPDGGRVLVTDDAGGAELFDVKQGKMIWSKSYEEEESPQVEGEIKTVRVQLPGGPPPAEVALAPDASAVAFAHHQTKLADNGDLQSWIDWIEVYSLPGGQRIWRQDEKLINAEEFAVSAGGKLVGVGYNIGAVRLWETATGATCKIEAPKVQYDSQLAIVKDGALVVLEAEGMHAWTYPDLKQTLSGNWEGTMGHAAADGTALSLRCASDDTGDYAAALSVGDEAMLWAPAHLAPLTATAVGAGGSPLIGGSVDGTVRAYDPKTGRELLDANDSDTLVDVSLARGRSVEIPIGLRGAIRPSLLKVFYNDDGREIHELLSFRTLAMDIKGGDGRATVRLYADPSMEPGLYVCKVVYRFSNIDVFFPGGLRGDLPRVFRVYVTE